MLLNIAVGACVAAAAVMFVAGVTLVVSWWLEPWRMEPTATGSTMTTRPASMPSTCPCWKRRGSLHDPKAR
jgi:hypothetical protein